jgi:hypothetical protein
MNEAEPVVMQQEVLEDVPSLKVHGSSKYSSLFGTGDDFYHSAL